jgi:transcriptional regulator with XRE-family HTH domain
MKCPYCDGKGQIKPEAVTVGTMILAVRKAKKLTQEQLCQKVSLSRAQVANIESGRSDMPLKTLARFAAALNCSMRDLMPE